MARPQGTSPRAQRLIALFAVCAIAIATAFAFGRVFAGHGSTWRLMGVALASALVASALERRNLLLATMVSAAVLAVVVGLLIFPGTTWHGLPTLDTLRHALDASHLVGEQARLQVAPSPPLKPLMFASVLAMWAAIFSCHALAFRAGSPILALLPPIAMLAFADTVLEEFIKPVYGVVFLAAALAIVFADALRRVQGWGPVWTGPGSRARLSATASRGARRVAVAAVGTAMIVPFIVPGFGSKAIFDISSTNASDRVRIDPLVSIKASLTRNDPVEVFQVQADAAVVLADALVDGLRRRHVAPGPHRYGRPGDTRHDPVVGDRGDRTRAADVHDLERPRILLAAARLSAATDRRSGHVGALQQLHRNGHARR